MFLKGYHWLILVFLGVSLPVSASIHYQVSIDQPLHHLAQITMTIPAGVADFEVRLPTWRTGRYQIINPANGIRNFRVTDKKNQPLQWQREDKSRWHILNPTSEPVTVNYQVYANELGSRSRHIDSSHAYLDATAVLMYVPQLMDVEHQVELLVAKDWQSFSGLKQLKPNLFSASNYHQLASSPIESGINQLREFSHDDKKYQLVMWGEGNYNLEQMSEDLEKIVAQASTIWDGAPFDKYVFIVHATSGESGATEHINSTVIQRPRFSFAPREEYLKFLRTAAHEFIHTWNVKAYRPQGLVPYDYQQENYSNLLWIAEGSTSYFQDRLLLTAGLETVKEYLKSLAERVDNFEHSPGHFVQSLSDSSYEKWIAQSGDFANNNSVNIYSEGFMASWLWDLQLLKDSRLKFGYKDIHHALFARVDLSSAAFQLYRASPYNTDDLLELSKQLTGKDYKHWWQENVDSPLKIDFDALLDQFGLKFGEIKKQDKLAWTGFKSKAQDGLLTVTDVEKEGPAWSAGLAVDDQIIALNGSKLTEKNLSNRLAQFKNGDVVELTLFRNDLLMQRTIKFGETTKKPRKIETQKTASDAQKQLFKAWLGIDYPAENSVTEE